MKWKDKHTAATSVSHHVRQTFYKVINSVYKWKSETSGRSLY